MSALPHVHVILDEDDDRDRACELQALHDPAGGRVVMTLTPGADSVHWLATDLLDALGKPPGLHGAARNAQVRWRRAMLWTRAVGAQHVIVLRAQAAGQRRLHALAEMTAMLQADLWLVFAGGVVRRGQGDWLQDWLAERVTQEQLVERTTTRPRRAARRSKKAAATSALDVSLPSEDFYLFRWRCRQVLDTDDFARVDRKLVQAHADTAQWLKRHPAATHRQQAVFMRELIRDAETIPEALCRLRGAQIAFFSQQWLVTVDTAALAGAHRPPNLSDGLTALARYTDPRTAAVAALSAQGATPADLVELRLSHTDANAGTVKLGGRPMLLTGTARSAVHTLAMERMMHGARPDDRLFTIDGGAGAWTVKGMHRRLRSVTHETGVPLASHYNLHAAETAERWVARHGIKIRSLRG